MSLLVYVDNRYAGSVEGTRDDDPWTLADRAKADQNIAAAIVVGIGRVSLTNKILYITSSSAPGCIKLRDNND